MDLGALITVMMTLFLLTVCGYICRKTGIINNDSSKGLSRLILAVGQPMMIIAALEGAEFNKENLTLAWQVTLIGFAVHLLLALAAWLICRAMKKEDKTKIFEFSLVFSNCGFLGFPILDSILGEGKGSFMGAFFLISFHLLLWTWGIIILARGREDIRMTPKKALINFGTIPCLIGVVLYLLKGVGFVLPAFFGKFFSYLGNLCTPISVLIMGALLATISLGKMFISAKLYFHAFLKLIVFPVAACLLSKLCGLGETYILLVTALVAVPSATTVTMLAEVHDIEPGFASQVVGLTSLLSTATLPAVMIFAQWVAAL
ncbi:MAG: AEC family transporter [Clostridia bacterium]|nr:AEC family transporter [Clostridia bacterium]